MAPVLKHDHQDDCCCSHGALLQSIADHVDELRTKTLPKIHTRISLLELKSGLWGAGAGILTALGTYLLKGH